MLEPCDWAQVQSEVAVALKDGATRVRLSAGQLPTVYFGSMSSDLYWGSGAPRASA